MKKFNKVSAGILGLVLMLGIAGPTPAFTAGPASVDLLTAGNFVILSKTGITNTGGHTTDITGDIGSSPISGSAMDNVFCSEITGTIYGVDATYVGSGSQVCFAGNPPLSNKTLVDDAIIDMEAAYADAAGRTIPTATELGGGNIGGMLLAPGLYKWSTNVTIPTNVILSGGASDVWIFQIAGDLNIASGGSVASGVKVILTGGASASNIFWQVGGPTGATLGTYSTFNGNILSAKQVIMQTGAVLTGRALAQTQVTLDANVISLTSSSPAQGTLHVVKTVINDNGGTAVASDFTLAVAGTNVSNSSFVGSESGVNVTLDAGFYEVTEPVVPAGYTQTGSGCVGTIAANEVKTCTITNDDDAPRLIVNKVVINDNGGTKLISAFPLFIDGSGVTSGVVNTSSVGLHTVSETVDDGYTATFGGDCASDGTITLVVGGVKTCTITNDDVAQPTTGGGGGTYYPPVPPLIELVKVPSPLALPAGSGLVTYTYTVRNIGTVSVSDVTLVGDSCSPITLVSDDANGNVRIEANQERVYTCSTNLTKTHTNIVTATAWSNGISTSDTASATVVVGVPIVPPLIHVTITPSKFVLNDGEGMVTYTSKVTNPGSVAISDIRLSNDSCGPVTYISGDVNGDTKLDTSETWIYTCQTNLAKTTVSTVSAEGTANGLLSKDVAFVTVVVSDIAASISSTAPLATTITSPAPTTTPKLPNTGLTARGSIVAWSSIIIAGIFGALTFFSVVRKKRKV